MKATQLQRGVPLAPGPAPQRRTPLGRETGIRRVPWSRSVPPLAGQIKSAATKRGASGSGRPKSFPKDVAAQLRERDPWCVHCGSADGLQNHHRRLKGIGGDGRDHTQCACNGVRLCRLCHAWAHSGNGRREAGAEGLIIPRSTLEPYRESVLVHTSEDGGGMRKYPLCDGTYADEQPEQVAA